MDEEKLIKKKQRAKRDGDIRLLAEILKELGDRYFQLGRLNEALQEYLEQKEACEVLNDMLNYAIANRMIGDVYIGLGELEQALEYHKIYLERTQDIGNSLEEQRAWATLGRTHFLLSESFSEDAEKRTAALDFAKKAYQKSIKICNRWEEMNITLEEIMMMRARLLLNWGLVFEAERELDKAIELYENAAALCTKHGLHEELHRIHLTLAAVHERREKYQEAIQFLDEAANVSDPTLKADAHMAKAELLLRMGNWTDARKILVSLYLIKGLSKDKNEQIQKYLRIAVTLCRAEADLLVKTDARDQLKLYEDLGDAAVAVNCSEKAIDYYRQMLFCAEESGSEKVGPALVSLARTLKESARYDEALIFARKELSLCTDPREISKSAFFLAKLLINAKASCQEIAKHYNMALENARKSDDIKLELSILDELLVYSRNNKMCTMKVEEIEERSQVLRDSLLLSDAEENEEEETESPTIGANISLDDLSDVEIETKATEVRRRVRGQGKRGQGYLLKRNAKGESQLHVACIEGNVEMVKKLLGMGHPTNVRDNCGWTPLHEAANHDHTEIAKLLIKNGADINDAGGAQCDGITPLLDAASCGNFSTIRILIKNGANLNAKSINGETVLNFLDDWRLRAGTLSTELETEYNSIRTELSSIVKQTPKHCKKRYDKENTDGATTNKHEDEKIGAAARDYKHTIELLRNRGRPKNILSSRTPHCIAVKVPALLSNEDILDNDDDWLEDDINSIPKRRSVTENDCLSIVSHRNSADSGLDLLGKTFNRKRCRTNSDDAKRSLSIDSNEDSVDNDMTELIDVSCSVNNGRKKRRRQASLLSAGFTKDSVSRTPSPVLPIPTSHNATKLMKLRIVTEGKTYGFEVELTDCQKRTVAALLQEIETKFYAETGCEAKFSMKGADGSTLATESTVNMINESDFRCETIRINIPPAAERYRTICSRSNIPTCETRIKCLKACENTSIFRLDSDGDIADELIVLLRTLEYQRNLRVLCLSGTSLFNFADLLNTCLKRQHLLQELHLQGCDINHDFLARIDSLPLQLRELDLSYNPLFTESLSVLQNLLKTLKYLQALKLRSCNLDAFFMPFGSNCLVNLDLSWNPLQENNVTGRGLERHLLYLNLSNTVQLGYNFLMTNIVTPPSRFLASLECLELANCEITDSDISYILPWLPNLSRFVIKANLNVTTKSINLLLNREPTLTYIDASGCKEINEFPFPEVRIKRPESCTLIVSMLSEVCQSWFNLWNSKGSMYKLPHNVFIFKPILLSR